MKIKRWLALLLTFCMLLSLAPAVALAETGGEEGEIEAAVQPQAQTMDLEDGYYLVGSMNNWTLEAAYKFTQNSSNSSEYVLQTTLHNGDEFKARKVENGTPTAWFPGGDNIVVGASQAGDATIYFRPDGNNDWSLYYFYIATPVSYHIEIAQPEHATLSLSQEYAREGTDITVTANVESGYYVQDLIAVVSTGVN